MKKTSRQYDPRFMRKQSQYIKNDLAFRSETEIKESYNLTELLPPTKTMEDPANTNRNYLWSRYLGSAIWHSYPKKYLEKVLGLTMKENPAELAGFDSTAMRLFYDYTFNGTSLLNVEAQTLTALCKFGSCIIKLEIPDDANLFNSTLNTKIIPACDVLEYNEKYIVWKSEKMLFDEETKRHREVIIVHVDALDELGFYYEAQMTEGQYFQWNFSRPNEKECISLVYPEWTSKLTELPMIPVSTEGIFWTWTDAYAQPIIDIAWHIFKNEADNGYALHQQSTSHLLIKGADPTSNYPIGLGAVHVFRESDTDEKYIAPPADGIKLQFEKLQDLNDRAENMLLNLISSTNASGESLKLQIGDKTNALINLVKIVGDGIQKISEKAAKILGENPDIVVFSPYIDFSVADEKATDETTA